MADVRPTILDDLPRVVERDLDNQTELDAALIEARTPFIVRGLVKDWPLVAAGRTSPAEARAYLLKHAKDRPFMVNIGPKGQSGRMFYDRDFGMNFRSGTGALPDIFAGIEKYEGQADGPTAYLGSVDIHDYFDGLHERNHLDLGDRSPLSSIWIGTQSRVAAHNDFPDNLACCAVGRRRFTLFPPEQFPNLYLGPIDNTPAGRAISMVDFHEPDFDAFPRFRDALSDALVAELEPGDALFIPSMWWHHVEGLDSFNVLVNYWWRNTPRYLGQPQDALNHAILSIRDLPEEEKAVWRQMFDYYVFENGSEVTGHIPETAQGILAPMNRESAGRLRSFLLRSLSR